MLITAFVVAIAASIWYYDGWLTVFIEMPLFINLAIIIFFLWKVLHMPYMYEINEGENTLHYKSLLLDACIPIHSIIRITLPPSYSRVQIGSIEHQHGKIYINATLKDTESFVKNLTAVKQDISVITSWFA
jgi:hypothetical protein